MAIGRRPIAPPLNAIAVMGENARLTNVEALLSSLRRELA